MNIDEMGNPQPSSKPNMGFIYSLTFPSGKKYIGQTTRNITKRLSEHLKCYGGCILLENAIKKYGQENIIIETLKECPDEELDQYEKQYIADLNTLEPNGYNIRTGGSNGKYSDDAKERMRKSKLGENNHNYGIPRSDSAKLAISKAKSGEKHHFYGKTFTEDHKLKLSQNHKIYDTTLPMYISYVKERPECYCDSGYAVTNHPILKNKHFTSKKFTMEQKLMLAKEYLNSA